MERVLNGRRCEQSRRGLYHDAIDLAGSVSLAKSGATPPDYEAGTAINTDPAKNLLNPSEWEANVTPLFRDSSRTKIRSFRTGLSFRTLQRVRRKIQLSDRTKADEFEQQASTNGINMSIQWTSPGERRPHAMHHRPSLDEAARFRMVSLLWFAGITLLLVPMATLLDIPIAQWFATEPLPEWIGTILDVMLYYAHGMGITCILLALLFVAPTKRWHLPRLAALAAGGGAISTLTKMFVLRPRPNSLPLSGANNDYAWIWTFDWTLSHVAHFEPSSRAFPSAYLATATALTVGLWVLFPKGRWVFLSLCFGTLMQRIYCGSHFLSDLFGSAAIGLWWSYVCYHPSLMGSLFDKLEPERDLEERARRSFKASQHLASSTSGNIASLPLANSPDESLPASAMGMAPSVSNKYQSSARSAHPHETNSHPISATANHPAAIRESNISDSALPDISQTENRDSLPAELKGINAQSPNTQRQHSDRDSGDTLDDERRAA